MSENKVCSQLFSHEANNRKTWKPLWLLKEIHVSERHVMLNYDDEVLYTRRRWNTGRKYKFFLRVERDKAEKNTVLPKNFRIKKGLQS